MHQVIANPVSEYRTRLGQRRERHATLTREFERLSYLRLATFGVGVLIAVLAWAGTMSGWWIVVPLGVFVALLVRHDRVDRGGREAARAIVFYERGIARIEDRWIGTGEPGHRFRTEDHLYANDLDLFGDGSLFELLSIARTRAGEDTLAEWLKAAAPHAELRRRHEAVVELTPALDLREAVANAGSDVRASVDTDALVAWAERPSLLTPQWLRVVTALVTAITVSTVVIAFTTNEYVPVLLALAAQAVFQMRLAWRVQTVLHGADGPARDLAVLHHIVRRLEQERLSAAALVSVRDRLATGGVPASAAIQKLERLVEAHDWEHNMLVTPIAVILMFGVHLAWAIEAWRRRYGRHIATWLRAIGELEALSSLSAYRYEHPGDPFPEIVAGEQDSAGGVAQFEGLQLGHPLLPAAKMVVNDVHLTGTTRLLVVSGSNMSGKSTLLRTVGINAVLALAGAPVRARSLRLTPLAIGATLRIQDSLQEGRSRFFAEITRIRQLADLAKARPLLFLLDELFHGTNSHDRLVGASGVLHSLLERGAIGLITTHDLAVTAVARDLAPRALNVHFEDRFERGEMLFDYRMKPGPVTHSNAVALMRAVGLDVGDESRHRVTP